jgi:hypothetical protein
MSRSRNSRNRRKNTARQGRPFKAIADQMTPTHYEAVREAADAELRGDAATALRCHRSVPMFARSNHGDRLELIAALGDDAPGWLISRWMTVQSRRRFWTGSDPNARSRVLPIVIPAVYPHGVPFERIGCEHPEQVVAWLNERDWVARQVDVYEMEALRKLVRHQASQELLARADQIEAWCSASMGGYRLEPEAAEPGTLRLVDLATDRSLQVLDLGAAEHLPPGQHVLGRLVPTEAGPGRMFDWRPLPVDRRTATAVARNPRPWLSILATRAAARLLPTAFSYLSETSMTADLPQHSWVSLLGRDVDVEPDELYDDLAELALAEALRLAGSDPAAITTRRNTVSELILDGALSDRVGSRFAAPQFLAAWRTLAEIIDGPARSRYQEMAMWSDAAPDDPDRLAG